MILMDTYGRPQLCSKLQLFDERRHKWYCRPRVDISISTTLRHDDRALKAAMTFSYLTTPTHGPVLNRHESNVRRRFKTISVDGVHHIDIKEIALLAKGVKAALNLVEQLSILAKARLTRRSDQKR
ncbi:hypothetical protein EVAR_99476_1 [Eumeta japonica]|uniref:Uncharacterized protein n=1 Tax=Eumeta variegata TaxID=151549 RepID=A0A4C1ZVG8_EUMVA|nr:hypothetical protein EVAR_99476_1 [Eumeta japonica]